MAKVATGSEPRSMAISTDGLSLYVVNYNSNTPPSGTFKPNEDATHEKGESAQREAQEDAGQRPTVP